MSSMYEIYLDESNGSIREEDDDIPAEEPNIDSANGDANKAADEGKAAPEIKTDTSLTSGSNNVWVSGLSSSTRAASLQTLFKKYGKVLSAKIITNPRMPGSRAHGFITMETAEQAEKCIQHLNKTELDGKTITVSKNRPSESSSSSRHKSSSSSSSSTKKDKPKDKDSKSRSDETKESDKDKSKDDSKKSDEKSSHDDDKKKKEKSGDKEKEKDRQKDRDKEKEKSKNREKDKPKDKEKEKEKKKDDDKDQSKEKDKDRDKGAEKDKSKEKDKDKTKEKDKDKDKEKDKDKSKDKDKDKDKKDEKKDDKSKDEKDADKKDESKDEIKIKKERSSKSPSRSRSRDRKKGSESPPRKLLGRRPMRRLAPAFLARRMNTRGRSSSSRPNPVLLRRIETERAQRRREREREIQEAKRRRIELIRTQREVERKAQEERDRLEREMVKLRIERERLEREKAEILRLEREKARLERERLERERDELRRKQFQLPHRIDDSPRGRSGMNKRPYDSRGDPRDMDLHWDDRKRMSAPSPVTASGRPFNVAVGSRMSDFDARHGHNSAPYENKGGNYRRMKLDNPSSGGASRNEYDMRRDSGRHGGSGGGHDRDDRRNTGGPSGSYYRDSARMTGSSRDRDRRGGGGGRDDWKGSHDRRDRYMDKGLASIGTGYGAGPAYSGGNSGEWTSGDRGSSNLSKLSYPAGPSVSESRSRGTGLSSSLMTGGGNQLNDLYDNSSNIPMAGIMSHGGIGSASGLTSDERPYMHSVRRF